MRWYHQKSTLGSKGPTHRELQNVFKNKMKSQVNI